MVSLEECKAGTLQTLSAIAAQTGQACTLRLDGFKKAISKYVLFWFELDRVAPCSSEDEGFVRAGGTAVPPDSPFDMPGNSRRHASQGNGGNALRPAKRQRKVQGYDTVSKKCSL